MKKENADSPALERGYQLQDYVIDRVLRQDPYGITYLAAYGGDESKVIIREHLPVGIARRDAAKHSIIPCNTDASGLEAFNRAGKLFSDEALAVSRLDHPGIGKIKEVFCANGTAYYVQPYVEGVRLSTWLRHSGTAEAPKLRAGVLALLSALEYLHGRGMLHGDIRPENILLQENGSPVLINFGTARRQTALPGTPDTATEGYTPAGPVPEQGPWTDLYALGATIYRIITGQCPSTGIDEDGEEAPPLSLANTPDYVEIYGAALAETVEKALKTAPGERWQSAAGWLNELATAPPPPPAATRIPSGMTPLMLACRRGDIRNVRSQLKLQGTALNASDRSGRTALMYAAEAGRGRMVEYLLECKTDIDAADKDGYSATMLAATNGHEEVLLTLLESGASPSRANNAGKTALMYAVQYGLPEATRLLLQMGVPFNAHDMRGRDVLWHAANMQPTVPEAARKTILSLLQRHAKSAKRSQKQADGKSPLRAVLHRLRFIVVTLRIIFWFFIIILPFLYWCRSNLFAIVHDGNPYLTAVALACGADVNQRNAIGDTPLHIAARKNYTDTVKVLLYFGADKTVSNKNGGRPIDYANEELGGMLE